MNTEFVSIRYDWADIAKGIGIFLMVMGHSSLPEPLHNWIYSFHMPFFFILSGFFFKSDKYTFGSFLQRRIKTILLPYVFFATSDVIIRNFCNQIGLIVPPPRSITQIVVLGKDIGAAWFLLSLFFTEVLFFIIDKVSRVRGTKMLITVLTFMGSYYCYSKALHFPYKIEILGATLLYYCLGNMIAQAPINKCVIEYCFKGKWILFLFGLFVLDLIIANQLNPVINLRLNRLGIHIPSLLLILFGSFIIIQSSHFISGCNNIGVNICRRFFKYIGEFSIVLIGFSQVTLQILKSLFSHLNISVMITTSIRYIMLWFIMLLLIYLFKNYMPMLIGKTKK